MNRHSLVLNISFFKFLFYEKTRWWKSFLNGPKTMRPSSWTLQIGLRTQIQTSHLITLNIVNTFWEPPPEKLLAMEQALTFFFPLIINTLRRGVFPSIFERKFASIKSGCRRYVDLVKRSRSFWETFVGECTHPFPLVPSSWNQSHSFKPQPPAAQADPSLLAMTCSHAHNAHCQCQQWTHCQPRRSIGKVKPLRYYCAAQRKCFFFFLNPSWLRKQLARQLRGWNWRGGACDLQGRSL